jgi:ParB/RepB/Spo0J family partition protein
MSTTVKNETQISNDIALSKIIISGTNPRKIFNDEKLKELSNSIKEHGVIQAILVRPKGKRFELICGERRFRASKLAGIKTIPSLIREVDDEQAFQMQIIENLERENVHPMNEAQAFKQVLAFKGTTNKTIADKLAKSESYVVQRLQLNSLIEQWQERFLNDEEVTLSHVLIISKHTAEVQEELLKDASDWNGNIKTAKELENYINRVVVRQLSNANFDPLKENLADGVGACISCAKRSGFNKLLFAEVEQEDTCFDKACFELKAHIQALNSINSVIQSDEEVLYLISDNDISQKVEGLIIDNGLSTLKQYTHFYNTFDDKEDKEERLPAIWLNGYAFGKKTFVKLTTQADGSVKKKMADCTPEERIKKIESKEIRSKELDAEKVHTKISNCLVNSKNIKEVGTLKSNDIDKAMGRLLIIESLGWSIRSNVFETLNIKEISKMEAPELIEYLNSFTDDEMAFIVRQSFIISHQNVLPIYKEAKLLRAFAEKCNDIEIDKFEAEQVEKAQSRIERKVKRVKELKKKIENQ